MGWKDLPYWLKGGIITIIILSLIQIILFITGILMIVSLISGNILTYLLFPITMYTGIEPLSYLWLVVSIVSQFVLGAIIGVIIGKIKSNK